MRKVFRNAYDMFYVFRAFRNAGAGVLLHAACMAGAAPAVSSGFATNLLRASDGTSVTISGLDFGSFSFTPSAMLYSAHEPCTSASWTSATTIVCASGMGKGYALKNTLVKVSLHFSINSAHPPEKYPYPQIPLITPLIPPDDL